MVNVFSICCLGAYFSLLVCFSFVSHPLGYCILLVGGSLFLSVVSAACYGFSWYLALFILVYVGGVYVLFLFVSVHSANSLPVLGGSFLFYALIFLFFCFSVILFFDYSSFLEEESRFLCSGVEGFSYLILCFTLLVGFAGVSIVSGQKDSFFR